MLSPSAAKGDGSPVGATRVRAFGPIPRQERSDSTDQHKPTRVPCSPHEPTRAHTSPMQPTHSQNTVHTSPMQPTHSPTHSPTHESHTRVHTQFDTHTHLQMSTRPMHSHADPHESHAFPHESHAFTRSQTRTHADPCRPTLRQSSTYSAWVAKPPSAS